MKNKETIQELKKLSPDDSVEIRMEMYKKSLVEICYHVGKKFGKSFSCESQTLWRSADVKTEDMCVEDIMKVLRKKDLSELTNKDFDGLYLEESSDGDLDVSDVEWDEPLTEEEESSCSSNDLYWDSEISDSELEFGKGSVMSLTITCGEYETTLTN